MGTVCSFMVPAVNRYCGGPSPDFGWPIVGGEFSDLSMQRPGKVGAVLLGAPPAREPGGSGGRQLGRPGTSNRYKDPGRWPCETEG
jgi:hypothetical protein